ncbi:MAG: redox-sensing transcriptional repressor Rex [Bacteroidaceae bacterium]
MNENNKQIPKIPEPSLRRLPWYLSCVKLKAQDGDKYISSTQISKKTGIDASQIAKDMSYIQISGRTRVGYDVVELIAVLEEFLGFTSCHNAFICGVGSLGGALIGDSGLMHFGLHIVAGFDVDPNLVGKTISGVPIYHMDDMKKYIGKYQVQIGVLTVPIVTAQKVTNQMTKAGIKAVWNFTPFRIRVPEGIVVQNTSLYAHLAVMFNRLNSQNSEGTISHNNDLDIQE